MQLTDHQQEILRSINALLGGIEVTPRMKGITFHSAGRVHAHIESNSMLSWIVELTFWTHSSQDRIQWLKGMEAKLADNTGHEVSINLKPDPNRLGGFKAELDIESLDGPGKLQLVWEESREQV